MKERYEGIDGLKAYAILGIALMFYRFGLIDMPDKVNGKMKRAGRQM